MGYLNSKHPIHRHTFTTALSFFIAIATIGGSLYLLAGSLIESGRQNTTVTQQQSHIMEGLNEINSNNLSSEHRLSTEFFVRLTANGADNEVTIFEGSEVGFLWETSSDIEYCAGDLFDTRGARQSVEPLVVKVSTSTVYTINCRTVDSVYVLDNVRVNIQR